MCTAIRYMGEELCFGRTLDYHKSYGETVTVMPRRYPLSFGDRGQLSSHYAVIGMTADLGFSGGYPLFYDGVNEKGLAMAGLNFVRNAVYAKPMSGRRNLAVHELVPWILGKCATVAEARAAFCEIEVTDTPFFTPRGEEIQSARLHWMVVDREEAVVVESVADGVRIYENRAGVLTNDPRFPLQMEALEKYLSCDRGGNFDRIPSDYTSPSRFIRGAVALKKAMSERNGAGDEAMFFRIMESVTLPAEGIVREDGERWHTIYTACMNGRGEYRLIPRGSKKIVCVNMHDVDLDGTECVACVSVGRQTEV